MDEGKTSYMYQYLTRRHEPVRTGGSGSKRRTRVMRVPLDTCEELNVLIDSWRIKVKSTSPRYDQARILLAELEDIIKHGSDY